MASLHPIREVHIALTVEPFDQAVQFYRDGLGLAVVNSRDAPTSSFSLHVR